MKAMSLIEAQGEYVGAPGKSLPRAKRASLSQMQICALALVIPEWLD